ncbi:MAG TPA: ABC transporter substrate-binding protein, partial [Mycobacteriales bacterium]|nr:ABC transporter substrate-binding protein [Mycobacteriales bacterium]
MAALAACSSKSSSGGGTQSTPTSAPSSSSPESSATKGDLTTPPAKPGGFAEAPSVKSMMGDAYVAVEQRLPDVPYVLPHKWVKKGKYGGTLNMVVYSSAGADAASNREFFYGFSPTRWLNDGLDVGPGSADKWTSNADASVWTIHFREGLKWSDGVDFDVADILFWYNDMAVAGHDAQTIPPDCISAKGDPCRMSRVDQYTLKLTYDAPQPLVADYLAAWVKGGIGGNGPAWILPRHYL